MAESNTEERLARLEHDVAELLQARRIQDDRDIALLARIDTFIDDLHRVERVQMRSFEELMAGQKETNARLEGQEAAIGLVIDTLKNHKGAIEELGMRLSNLEAGQQQILNILLGKPPIND